MSTIRRLPSLALTLTLTLGALLAGAPLALAQRIPDPPPPPDGPVSATSHGSPLWVFILVAAVTAVVAVLATWLVSSRLRRPHQTSAAPA